MFNTQVEELECDVKCRDLMIKKLEKAKRNDYIKKVQLLGMIEDILEKFGLDNS